MTRNATFTALEFAYGRSVAAKRPTLTIHFQN